MKVECPQCRRMGILETRGNSQRIVHYEYVNGRRVFSKHLIKGNGNTSMGTMGTVLGTEKAVNRIPSGNEAPPKGLEPLTDWLTASRST